MDLHSIEIVADRTADSRPDEGFLQLKRLRVRNHYSDGSHSAEYSCDLVQRVKTDAVAIVLWGDRGAGPEVVLRRGIRVPAYLRKDLDTRGRDEPLYRNLNELVAGILEPEDHGVSGILSRAAIEAHEEAGYQPDPASVAFLGEAFFPSPGMSPERVYLTMAKVDLDRRSEPQGDGSVMEEGASVEIVPLTEALEMCRDGRIVDAKTEIGLRRFAELRTLFAQTKFG